MLASIVVVDGSISEHPQVASREPVETRRLAFDAVRCNDMDRDMRFLFVCIALKKRHAGVLGLRIKAIVATEEARRTLGPRPS